MWGGNRKNAGRKLNTGPYREPTQALRIPVGLVPLVKLQLDDYKQRLGQRGERYPTDVMFPAQRLAALALPQFSSRVSAGFPSPADDHVEQRLDLNQHLIQHPAATFFVRVQGESMLGAGIHDGDLLVVDRALTPADGKVVVAALNGELTVKRLRQRAEGTWLEPENPAFVPLQLTEALDCIIWGVVTNVIHAL